MNYILLIITIVCILFSGFLLARLECEEFNKNLLRLARLDLLKRLEQLQIENNELKKEINNKNL